MYHMVFILFNPAKLNKDVMSVEFNMAQFKLVVSDNKGKSISQELKDRPPIRYWVQRSGKLLILLL